MSFDKTRFKFCSNGFFFFWLPFCLPSFFCQNDSLMNTNRLIRIHATCLKAHSLSLSLSRTPTCTCTHTITHSRTLSLLPIPLSWCSFLLTICLNKLVNCQLQFWRQEVRILLGPSCIAESLKACANQPQAR